MGTKKPNGLGLYDMSGNVWEWVEDCWHENYSGAPTDGTAWGKENGGDCGQRVFRGGCWNDVPGTCARLTGSGAAPATASGADSAFVLPRIFFNSLYFVLLPFSAA